MKILQLTHKPPVPSVDGGCLAMRQISDSLLKAGVNVKVVSIATMKHPVIYSEEFINYKNSTQFESVTVCTNLKISNIFKSIFRGTSLQADRFFSKEMTQKLKTVLEQEPYDVVILESVFVGNYIETIKKYTNAKIILRVHNIEHLIWERLSKQTRNPLKKLAYQYLAKTLKRFELSLFHKIDGYMPITEVDYRYFKEKFPNLPAKVIPFAVTLSNYPYQEHAFDKNNISLFHIGSMNWQPNIEGMKWFLNHVWNKITRKHPNLTLVLAGKGNKAVFGKETLSNVQIFDFVDDAQQFMNRHTIMVVPLLSGSGMRIKIMEGLALGKPIITTTIGAEGIAITDKENIFLADTPEAMIETIDFCVTHLEACAETGKNARKLIEAKYAQEVVIQDLLEVLFDIPPITHYSTQTVS